MLDGTIIVWGIIVQSLKRITRTLAIILLVIILLPVAAYFLLSNESVQQKLIHKLTSTLSREMHADVSIRDIKIYPDLSFTLYDVCIKIWGDTLIYSKETNTRIVDLDVKKKIFHFGNSEVVKGFFNMKQDSANNFNINVMVDALTSKSTDTTKPSLNLVFDNIKTHYSSFHLTLNGRNFDKRGVDVGHMAIDNVSGKLENLKVFKGNVSMNISDLSFLEKSGFMVNRMNVSLFIGKGDLRFGKVIINTPYSDIKTDHLYFHAASFQKYSDFLQNVKLDYEFLKSNVSFKDITYWAPQLLGVKEKFTMSGHFIGTIADFKVKKLSLRYGQHTLVEGDGSMNGLPDIYHSYIYFNAKRTTTHFDDIQQIIQGFTQNPDFRLPPQIAQLGEIKFRGNYTGFINDFVTYGNFQTEIGVVNTDLMIKPNQNNTMVFSGNLQSIGFNLGQLIQNKLLGTVDLDARIDGVSYYQTHDLNAILQSNVHALQFNKYTYHDIEMNGEFSRRFFSGTVSMNDPNAQFDFSGKLDFSQDIPEHHFLLNIEKANLYKLNFSNRDSAFTIGCRIKADFKGNNLDNLNGNVTLVNAWFLKAKQQYQLNNAILSVSSSSDSTHSEQIELNSDIADVKLNGRYDFRTFLPSLSNILHVHLNNLIPFIDSTAFNHDNNFVFTMFLKKTKKFTAFFLPELQLAENTFINGTYNPLENDINFALTADYLNYKNILIDNPTIASRTADSVIEFDFGCDKISVNDRFQFNRMFVSNTIQKNTISSVITWKNEDTSFTKERLVIGMDIERELNPDRPLYVIYTDSSRFSVMGEKWSISRSKILIDSSSIHFVTCRLNKTNQSVQLGGTISVNPSDTFSCQFTNMQLNAVNLFLDKKILKLDGYANGYLNLLNAYKNPVLSSDLKVNDFSLNDEKIGMGTISAHWIGNDKKINLSAAIGKEANTAVEIKGDYYPSSSKLDFNIALAKFKLRPIGMYLKGILSIADGTATGNMTLSGTTADPYLNGKLNVQRFSFGVDYLKTKYAITTPVTVENNRFVVKNGTIYDDNGKEAKVQAWLFFNRFRDISFDVALESKDFLLLNTREADNDYFYGSAYGSGIARISGTPTNVKIDLDQKTNKNTHIYIPLKTGDIQEKKFITFVNKEAPSVNEESETSSTNSGNGIILDVNIEATPDAEVELIFDPIIGDALKASGSGNIRLEIDNLGKFKMYGRYTVNEGDYKFTLQNIISRKLDIEKGGVIDWQGDPLDANLDLKAIYHTRSSLDGILPSGTDKNAAKTKEPVDCWLYLTGKLMNPTMRYDINLPNATEDKRSSLKAVLNPDELSKQFIWLLVTNSFYIDASRAGSGQAGNSGGSIDLGGMKLDRFGNVEVGLSRQLFNDRVSISGNVDYYSGQNANPGVSTNPAMQNKVMGDFNVEVKITDNGKLRAKAFNRANDQYLTGQSSDQFSTGTYKQGVGLIYQEEFNTVGDLIRSYWRKIFKKGSKEKN